MPNYAQDGFWAFLHRSYRAEYIVVDAKNHCNDIEKSHVLQLANYLSEAGTGLFGAILTRKGETEGALITRREQWLIHRKMILTFDDVDLQQMLETHAARQSPEEVVRQKLQDFRLSF